MSITKSTINQLINHAQLTAGPEMITLRGMCREGSDVFDIIDAMIKSGEAVLALVAKDEH